MTWVSVSGGSVVKKIIQSYILCDKRYGFLTLFHYKGFVTSRLEMLEGTENVY